MVTQEHEPTEQTGGLAEAGRDGPASPPDSPTPPPPLRWGLTFAVAVPLIVLNTGWIANSEMKTGVTEITISTLFIGVLFLLFLVTLVNLAVRRLSPRTALSQPEMMALYALLSMASSVAGVGHFGFFTPFLVNPFYYADNTNGWHDFTDRLPWYVGPRDPAVIKGFYIGHATFFEPRVMAAWAGPLAVWCAFFLVLLWTTLCLAAIVRRRWADEEHLPFPVIALPLEITREGAPIYKNRVLWAGFAVPCFLHSLNSLHSVIPGMPSMPINSTKDFVGDASLKPPWSGADTLFYQLHPAGLGFGYLINTDVSFSLWFFYLWKKALGVFGVILGWRDAGQGWGGDPARQFPFTAYQGYGAWMALGVTTLWAGRGYYRDYLRRAWRGDREGVDGGELLSGRAAVLGFLGGYLALCAFVWSSGGSWWLPVAFLGVYLLIMVALTRLRAEAAVLSTELLWISPQTILPAVLGTSGLSQADAVHMGMLSWFNSDYRAAAMPHELEGVVGVERAGGRLRPRDGGRLPPQKSGRLRPLAGLLMLAAAVAMVSALLWDLQLYYVNGADTGHVNGWRIDKAAEPWDGVSHWLHDPKPADPNALLGAVAGFAITALLTALRARFVGFPLHPAAYVLNTSFANDFFWGDMFVAWLVKSLLLRYGGLKAYRQMMPFFLGLILGDFITGAVWSLIGTALHLHLFRTFAT